MSCVCSWPGLTTGVSDKSWQIINLPCTFHPSSELRFCFKDKKHKSWVCQQSMSNTQRGEGEEEEASSSRGRRSSGHTASFIFAQHTQRTQNFSYSAQTRSFHWSQVSHLYVSSFVTSTVNCSVCESAASSTQQLISLYNRLYCIVVLEFCQRETFNSMTHPQVWCMKSDSRTKTWCFLQGSGKRQLTCCVLKEFSCSYQWKNKLYRLNKDLPEDQILCVWEVLTNKKSTHICYL